MKSCSRWFFEFLKCRIICLIESDLFLEVFVGCRIGIRSYRFLDDRFFKFFSFNFIVVLSTVNRR